MTTGDVIVHADRVSRVFQMPAGPVTAVHDVTLDIRAGDYMAVRGPSGCGKSTLLHMLGCVDAPTAGTLLFDGHDVQTLSDRTRSLLRLTHLGFVFQRFFLLPMLTAWENVELPQSEAGASKPARHQRTRELLGRIRRAGRTGRSSPVATVGWRNATRRDRARAGEPAPAPAGRRANRGARQRQRRSDRRPARPCKCRRHRARHRHARPGAEAARATRILTMADGKVASEVTPMIVAALRSRS